MKRILFFIGMVTIVSLAIVSCKDDFNEQDFLALQHRQRLEADSILRARDKQQIDSTSEQAVREYVNAANEAGDLLAVTLLVRDNGVPVPGVAVTLTTGTAASFSSGRIQATQNSTTDASGNVVFDRVIIGSGSITVSKNGYTSATALVDFGQPAAPVVIQVPLPNGGGTVNKYVPPQKRFEEAILPVFSATPSEGTTATIRGRVTIENDVTNLTPEVPAGVVIRANLAALVAAPGGFVTSYVFAENSSLGVATVSASGDYTMLVPANTTNAGLGITMIIPNIDGTCRMAVNGYDNGTGTAIALAAPEYRDVPTSWGPQANGGVGTTIPAVVGARVVVPAAPAAGSGFAFDAVRVGRIITTGTINSTGAQSLGTIDYKILSRGQYTAVAPTVTVQGGGGSGATATAALRTMITALTLTNGGSGYVTPQLNIVATLSDGSTPVLSSVGLTPVSGALPSVLNLNSLDGTGGGFGPDEGQINLPATTTALSVTVTDVGGGTGGVITADFFTDLASVTITNSGNGYTTAPTFVFSGGGSNPTHAQISVLEFPVYWDLTPNNTATVAYPVLPDFSLFFPPSQVTGQITSQEFDLFSISGVFESDNFNMQDAMMLSGGQIVKRFPALSYRTEFLSETAPVLTVINQVPANARFSFATADINSTTGVIASLSNIDALGNGYGSQVTATVVPTIAGAPGSGATIQVNQTYSNQTGEWSVSGATVSNGGSGYLPNLNRRAFQASSFPGATNVQSGKSYTVDIVYGTGNRRVAVN